MVGKPKEEDPDVLRFVSIALDMRERGIEPPLAEICSDRPELVDDVERALRVAERLPALGQASENLDPFAGLILADRYRLLQTIGAGSMGYVYRGIDEDLGREVAIKILRSDLFGGSQAEARFLREAEALAAVQHRSVVAVYDRGHTEDGMMYLVMELVDGVPLDDILHAAEELREQLGSVERVRDTEWLTELLGEKAPLESTWVRQCVRWMWQLAEGLQCAHEAGIFHRDVKPSNIIIRRDGTPALIDFGIAALDAEATIASGDRIVGTPSYMAPERLTDAPVTASVDVYGLAATLYYAVTLDPPYRGTSTEVLARLQRRDPPPAQTLRSDLPRDLQAILDTGMAREVAHRYPTSDAMCGDLLALLENRPVVARPTTVVERVWRRAKRSREVKVLGAVAAVVAVTLVVQSVLAGQRATRERAWWQEWAGVPPTLCVAPSWMRAIQDPEAQAMESARLDRLVELASSAVPSRVIRAAFRLDHGDRQGAADDFALVAAELDTPIARELARRYADLPVEAADVPTQKLPLPTCAEDRYLAAFHLIRNVRNHKGAFQETLKLLDEETTRALHYAAEMRLLHDTELASRKKDRAEQLSALRSIRVRAAVLAERIGTPTASTHMASGLALYREDRFHEAIEPLKRGVELAPSDHSLRINLAHTLQSARRADGAREHVEHAIRLRPASIAAQEYLVKILLLIEDFDAAERAVHDIPYTDDEQGEGGRRLQFGNVHYRHAFHAYQSQDLERAATIAAKALEYFVGDDGSVPKEWADEALVCHALSTHDTVGIYSELVRSLAQNNPTSWRDIEVVTQLTPDDLDADQTAAIRYYFESLTQHLAPNISPESPAPSANTSKEDHK